MVVNRIRRSVAKFWTKLDSEGVGLFQAVVYTHIAAGGLYGAAVAKGTPAVIEKTLGHTVAMLWLFLCMGAVICLAGKLLMKTLVREAIYMQFIGDILVLGSLVSYTTSTLNGAYWGKELFAVFIVVAIAECVLLLVIRDVRRIRQVERIYRQ